MPSIKIEQECEISKRTIKSTGQVQYHINLVKRHHPKLERLLKKKVDVQLTITTKED